MNTKDERQKPAFKPFIMGLILGALAGMVGMYLHQSNTVARQPVKVEAAAPVDCVPAEVKSAEPTVRPSKDPKDYEFYGVLENVPVTPSQPDLEEPLPPPPVEREGAARTGADKVQNTTGPVPSPAKPFYLQVASFKAETDADALKARIVLAGEPAMVVAMDIPEKGTHYRVRVGPFGSQDDMAKAKAQLGQGGIDLRNAFVVR